MALGVLPLITALASPSRALAGTYAVQVCTPANNAGIDVFDDTGTQGVFVQNGCGTTGELKLRAIGPTVKGGKSLVLFAGRDTNFKALDLERFFPGGPFPQHFNWGLIGEGESLEFLGGGQQPPANGAAHYDVHRTLGPGSDAQMAISLRCNESSGCTGNAGATLAEVTVKNIVATLGDTSAPIGSITAPSSTKPLRGTVPVPYVATDTGGGFRGIALNADRLGPGPDILIALDEPSKGGECREIDGSFRTMVPCLLSASGTLSVDTTMLTDGPHTITPFFVDAARNVSIATPEDFPILVHNAPTNTQRPALSGTAKVGETLTASKGQWDGTPDTFAFKWLRCPKGITDKSEAGCAPIAGATAAQYTATAADVDKSLVAKVTATNFKGPEPALSPPSAPVAAKPGNKEEERRQGNAPQTKLAKHPRMKTSLRTAKFTFSSDQPGSSFQCKLDKGQFKACRSPFKRKVRPGRHSFQVRAVNSAGAADPTPAKFNWKVL